MRWKALPACAALVVGLTVVAAPAAEARAGGFPGAGYKVAGVRTLTMTFPMPSVDCAAAGVSHLGFGLFAPDLSWGAEAAVSCYHGHASAGLETMKNGQGGGIAGLGLAAPGNRIQVTLAPKGGRAKVVVRDLTVHESQTLTVELGTSGVAAGAYAEGGATPSFPDLTVGLTANGGTPFAKFDHVRHTQHRGGVKVIGTGFPWTDGVHFNLYFKHQ